ncbi:MAG: hypothetical protein WCQ32_01120 [bacterium]
MLIQTWSQVFQVSLLNLWYGFIGTFPKIVFIIVLFIVGWIVAKTIATLVTKGIDALKIDSLFKSAGTEEILARAGWKLHIGGLIGWVVKWLIILGFLVTSADLLGLSGVTAFLSVIWFYIPQVLLAALILIAGTVLADFVRKLITGGAAIAQVRASKMIGTVAYYAIWVLSIVTALDKLGILGYFGQVLFTGIIIMLALAFGLAFGLGGKDAAARFINRTADDLSSK